MSSTPGQAASAEPSDDASGRSLDPISSTSSLVVELSQLRDALRAHTARSVAAADDGLRALLRRRGALLRELRRRGLDLPDERVEPRRAGKRRSLRSTQHRSAAGSTTPVDLAATVEHLQQGLLTRTVIGQAQGILIERHKVTPDVAFRLLVRASNDSNRKLRDVAATLVLTGELAEHD